jgi:hypothetical protein
MNVALKALIGWTVLMLVGTNLIGFFVRGLFQQRQMKRTVSQIHEIAAQELKRNMRVNLVLNVLSGAICISFPFTLYRWLGWQVAAAGLLLMMVRLPDLILEIRIGQKLTRETRPRGLIYTVSAMFMWLALPLVYWGLINPAR